MIALRLYHEINTFIGSLNAMYEIEVKQIKARLRQHNVAAAVVNTGYLLSEIKTGKRDSSPEMLNE